MGIDQRVSDRFVGGVLPAGDTRTLVAESGLSVGQFIRTHLRLASGFAQPVLSGFEVGAVGYGVSGALYLGANFEFPGCALDQTIHAEQAVVINAVAHDEAGLTMLAVSAAPCGHCRQFLSELAGAAELEILLPGDRAIALRHYLPDAFGPADLGVDAHLLAASPHPLRWRDKDSPGSQSRSASAEAALVAASASYAPYSRALAGVGLTMRNGATYSGPYLENAAFNPSVLPMQSAIVVAALSGQTVSDAVEASLVHTGETAIDHAAAARGLLERCAPGVELNVFEARAG